MLLHDFPIRNNYRMVNHQPNNVSKAIINHPNFHGSYNPFMVQLGMVYYFFTNIINHIFLFIYIFPSTSQNVPLIDIIYDVRFI